MRAIKLLENFCAATVGHAHAAVYHFHFDVRQRAVARLHAQRDFFLFVRIFFGIGEQVHDHLRDGIAIRINRQRLFRQLTGEAEAICFEMRAKSRTLLIRRVRRAASAVMMAR